MLLITIKLILVYGALTGILWLFCLFLYNYLYTEPATGMVWKIPVGAALVVLICLVLPLWLGHWIGYELPVKLGQIFMRTEPVVALEFDRIIVNENGTPVVYRREGRGLGPLNFVSADANRRRFPAEVSEFTAVTKDNQQITFRALRDDKGPTAQRAGTTVYVSDQGYRMERIELGRVEINKPLPALLSYVVIVLGLASWIGAFLLAQFNVGHSIGLGAALYFAWLFFIGFVF